MPVSNSALLVLEISDAFDAPPTPSLVVAAIQELVDEVAVLRDGTDGESHPSGNPTARVRYLRDMADLVTAGIGVVDLATREKFEASLAEARSWLELAVNAGAAGEAP